MASFLRRNVRLVGLQQRFLCNWAAIFIGTLLHDLAPTPDYAPVGGPRGSMQHSSFSTVQAVCVLSSVSSGSSSPPPSSVSTPRGDDRDLFHPADQDRVANWQRLHAEILQRQDELADLQQAQAEQVPGAQEVEPEETARQQQLLREIYEKSEAMGGVEANCTPETQIYLRQIWDTAFRRREWNAAAARRRLQVPADIEA